jgi:hypothetical protein
VHAVGGKAAGGDATARVSVSCLRGEHDDRITAPLGTILRVLDPHVHTDDEMQVATSTQLRVAMRAAAAFLHIPALAPAVEPL